MEYRPYTYIVWDTQTDRYYIGSKYAKGCTPENTTDYYGTGGEQMYRDAVKERPNTMVKTVLAEWSTKEEAVSHETLLHECLDVGNNPKYYNMSRQTGSGFSAVNNNFAILNAKMNSDKEHQSNAGKRAWAVLSEEQQLEKRRRAAARANRKVISMNDGKVTTYATRNRHEQRTGYSHSWVEL